MTQQKTTKKHGIHKTSAVIKAGKCPIIGEQRQYNYGRMKRRF